MICRAGAWVQILRGKTPSDWRKEHYYHYYEYPGSHMVKRHIKQDLHKKLKKIMSVFEDSDDLAKSLIPK